MESQDEFQFKPINEGLGFYKKKPMINLDPDRDSTDMNSQELSDQMNAHKVQPMNRSQYEQKPSSQSVFQQKDKEIPYITDPGIQFDSEIDKNVFDETQRMAVHQNDIFSPHLQQLQNSNQMPYPKSTDMISKATNSLSQEQFSQQQHPHNPPPLSYNSHSNSAPLTQAIHPNSTYPNTPYQAHFTSNKVASHQVNENTELNQEPQNLAPHFGAWLLDLFVIIGLVHICIVPLLFITELNISYVLTNIQTDLALQISLAILFLAVLNFYLITTRNFFGSTLGEWSFDISLGNAQKRQSPIYPILIAWRCLLMNITGVVTLPFLGFITRTDILGKLTSVRLTRSL